jgi:UDP-N-acetylglucosamine/UDP-N-acetylgalactosamine diphosphorylase
MQDEASLRASAAAYGQEHVFRFWEQLDSAERAALLAQVAEIDFTLMQRLAETWIFNEPAAERFNDIKPLPVLPPATLANAREAWDAGEAALRAGRVGLFLVAGGQGTRLGFEGPKGAYPVGPLTGKSLFQYHAEKIGNLQRRYGRILPWYIMVSDTNEAETRAFFAESNHFGLNAEDIIFLTQRMVPCMDAAGKFMLEAPGALAMNPNGHGGSLPAMVERGILDDARRRGVDLLSFFQVDNWAVQVADPFFIGYHVLHGAGMSSKNHRKHAPRESVGVHCLCDGQYRVIEYSELDLYPQLLETDAEGKVICYAGNPAIHMLSVEFVQRLYDHFDEFPWHLAHKKIPYLDQSGALVKPDKPNGYKFETFVFDALRFITHPPLGLEIVPEGEYTPIKQFDGDNSVVQARRSMANYWGGWIEAAGGAVPRGADGNVSIPIEISPLFAWTRDEFVEKARGMAWPASPAGLSIGADGTITV